MKNFPAKAEDNRGYRGILLTNILYWRTPIAPYKERGSMTREEAKRELRPIKEMESDIRSVELEIERLMAVATKMTPSYDVNGGTPTHKNKIEEALIKIDEYRTRLSKLLLESIDYKNRCLNKISLIEPASLRKPLILYYFQDKTLEQTSEILGKSYQWTYELYTSALDEYAKIS